MAGEQGVYNMRCTLFSLWIFGLMGFGLMGCASKTAIPSWEVAGEWPLDSLGAIMAVAHDGEGTYFAGGVSGWTATGTDHGQNWTVSRVQENDSSHFRAVAIPEKNAFFAVSAGQPALIYKSVDAGASWRLMHRDSTGLDFYDALHFFNGVKGMVYGDATDSTSRILLTEDNGESWKALPSDRFSPNQSADRGFAASNSLISSFGRKVWVATSNALWKSMDFGENWTLESIKLPASLDSAEVGGLMGSAQYDDRHGVLVGGDWNRPDWNEATVWVYAREQWQVCEVCPGHVADVLYLPGYGGKVLVAGGQSGIWQSTDGGLSWEQITDLPVYTLTSSALGDMIVASSRGKMYRLVQK